MEIREIKDIWSNEWLIMKNAHYLDKNGLLKEWQYVERVGKSKVVTIICQNTSGNILLIREARVPINATEISFPAGLAEANESLAQAALRELKEETGYDAKVLTISPLHPKSAGLTSEEAAVVHCITSDQMAGPTGLEETEDIEHFWVNPKDFFAFIEKIDAKEVKIAHDVYCFMAGYNFRPQKKKKKKHS